MSNAPPRGAGPSALEALRRFSEAGEFVAHSVFVFFFGGLHLVGRSCPRRNGAFAAPSTSAGEWLTDASASSFRRATIHSSTAALTDTANRLVPGQRRFRRALAVVFAWLQAMESTSFDYALDRIESLEREVGRLKEEPRQRRDTGPVGAHNGSAAGLEH